LEVIFPGKSLFSEAAPAEKPANAASGFGGAVKAAQTLGL